MLEVIKFVGAMGAWSLFLITFVLPYVNPPSWGDKAVFIELAVFWIVMGAAKKAMDEKEEKAKEETQRRVDTERFQAELKSKEQVELEKHRLTLEAQGKSADVETGI